MARLPYLDRADLAPENQDLLPRSINLYRLLAHSPGASRHFRALGQFIRHGSRLDARLRELAILQVGWLTRSPYEFSHHVKIGREFGVTDADIRAITVENAGGASSLEPLARTVLRAAREMTRDLAVSEATLGELKASLDPECLVDLLVTIAFYNGVVRLLGSLDVEVEPEYQSYLDEFPLPGDASPR
ncbi:MAG: carboxymuconolactone decarboxylase family protein [Alphaproteobacteria bacterium]|nr:carboxymuconolactone decarboxylase family protein [Alphaproteobacteria bacterium]